MAVLDIAFDLKCLSSKVGQNTLNNSVLKLLKCFDEEDYLTLEDVLDSKIPLSDKLWFILVYGLKPSQVKRVLEYLVTLPAIAVHLSEFNYVTLNLFKSLLYASDTVKLLYLLLNKLLPIREKEITLLKTLLKELV